MSPDTDLPEGTRGLAAPRLPDIAGWARAHRPALMAAFSLAMVGLALFALARLAS